MFSIHYMLQYVEVFQLHLLCKVIVILYISAMNRLVQNLNFHMIYGIQRINFNNYYHVDDEL